MENVRESEKGTKTPKGVDEGRKFLEVRRKRKRDKETDMEVSEGTDTHTPAKKPFFPPVDASSVLVS